MTRRHRLLTAVAIVSLLAGPALAQPAAGLAERFQTPGEAAKPRVWWHWMNGNVTQAGIDADLRWMKSVGLGGFQNFDASLGTPVLVDKRLVFMTPEWKQAFQHAVGLAGELGLEMSIAASPGWSETGGPWVKPEEAMKKMVWSETFLTGGMRFKGVLPKPPTASGPFQNLEEGAPPPGAPPPSEHKPELYKDQVVLAFPAPAGRLATPTRVTSSGGAFTYAALTDGDLRNPVVLPIERGRPAFVAYAFDQPQTVKGLTLSTNLVQARFGPPGAALAQRLEASDDGIAFRTVASFTVSRLNQRTYAFAPVTARHFRLAMEAPAGQGAIAPVQISEFVLHGDQRVNRFEDKAGFSAAPDYYALATTGGDQGIDPKRTVDLTRRMSADGTLDWTPPAGDWVVMRIGYSLTGAENGPASPEATGLEVDKLNAASVRKYIDAYLGMYRDASGGRLGQGGVRNIVTDSWEAEHQNWSDDILSEFRKRRGYDPKPWLPALAGRAVGSAGESDQFLWDFRRTIADLVAEAHYDTLTRRLHDAGMRRYGEAHESGRAVIADGMEMKRSADIPMAAMWVAPPGSPNRTELLSDIRESASVARIYGQNLVAAESLTSNVLPWGWSPRMLKPTADLELVTGVNQFVLHTSVHQPLNAAPGIGLGPFGQWFTRNETWADMAGPWISYLARSSQLLQEGRSVSDIAYFYGEEAPVTALFAQAVPVIPEGYAYDFVNADILRNELAVKGGVLVAPTGAPYRLIYLGGSSSKMTLDTVKALGRLVRAGAVVVGARPEATPSLADKPKAWQAAVDEVWGHGPVRTLGKGRIYANGDLAAALRDQAVTPDFSYAGAGAQAVQYLHRTTPEADIYFVVNRTDRPQQIDARFRVDGRLPEIWRADNAEMKPASYRMDGGSTTVPLSLDPSDALFVVFRGRAAASQRTVVEPLAQPLVTVAGAWDVAFQPGRGAPAAIRLDTLADLSSHPEPGVKYFSGVATYAKTIEISAADLQRGPILLDLGDVAEVAEVTVNGTTVGVAWKPPYRVDVTAALKPGPNTLGVKVANLWPNRLIGDKQPGATPIANATPNPYQANASLPRSGLIGPVRLLVREGAK